MFLHHRTGRQLGKSLQNEILPGVKSKQKFTMTFVPNQNLRLKDNLIFEKALL